MSVIPYNQVLRAVIAALSVGLCLSTVTSCRRSTDPRAARANAARPNILLISIDALRPDHLGCYGYSRPTSPRIDELAAEGALFENAISSTSWTLPAHAALFTGLVDSVHGCVDTDRRLAENRHTLAERLREAGYATVGFFSGPYLHPVFGLGQGFDEYVDCTSYAELMESDGADSKSVDNQRVHTASHRDITSPQLYARVGAWLRARERRPFFMFVHMWDVHFDFIPPPPYDTRFDPEYRGTFTGRDFLFNAAVNASMPRRDLEHVIALYDGEIAWTDKHVGRMLDDLDALGLGGSTIVVLLSDHGTEFFEHGRKAHRQSLYDEVIRIPLIVRYPGRIAAGQRHADQACIVDVLPTILDLAGLGEPSDLMGQSLRPLFSGAALRRDNLAISELFCDSVRLMPDGLWERKDPRFSIQQRLRSYRRSDRKMINDLNRHQTAVFDLRADPGEQQPLDEVPPAVTQDAERAREWLRAFRQALPTDGTQSTIPPEVLAKLKSLGYIGGDEEEDGEPEQPPP
jgi:arylsulfatase A-like enzyme